ncbi:MAG TPA: SPFH domain-containing protein [Rhodopila sp.]
MTAHDDAPQPPEQALPTHFAAAGGLVRPLSLLALLTVVAAAVPFSLSRPGLLPGMLARRIPSLPGFGLGITTSSLLLAACGLIACLFMVLARRREMTARSAGLSRRRPIAGWPQTLIILVGAAAAVAAVVGDWPHQTTASALGGISGFTVASVMLLLATPWLLAERMIAAMATQRLPEAPDLANLLFLPVACLSVQAVLMVASSMGGDLLYWGRLALSVVLLAISAELCLRMLASRFLPPPDSAAARAPIGSVVAGLARGRALSPAAMASTVRSQFGMDFSRSWALHFIRASAAPVALLMLAFCWFLTGVTRVDLNERAAYERLGTVATVLKPGLHLLLPWPFGAVRHVAFGVINSELISTGDQAAAPDVVDRSTAEGDAPASANRLWDSEQPTDVSYIIASSEQGRQSFQTVSASARVLYRIGLEDDDARAALYHEADPAALVHALAGRLFAQYFASRTLPSVLGESQSVIADEVRTQLRQALEQLGSGIDIVAVTIEAIHPPAGAASAYRNVQAAEIEATTSIAAERGRAQTTRSVAQRDAHSATDDATAAAAETVSGAQVDLTGIIADDRPYRTASRPFLLERYFADVTAALADAPLEIVDHRLAGASLPTIDLRPPGMSLDASERHSGQQEKTP